MQQCDNNSNNNDNDNNDDDNDWHRVVLDVCVFWHYKKLVYDYYSAYSW